MLDTPAARRAPDAPLREPLPAGRVVPVILCGGSGTRLWPASCAQFPKPLLPVAPPHSLLQRTALRVAPGRDRAADFARPVLICNERHRFLVQSQLELSGTPPRALLLEPEGRNTAPAIAAVAHYVSRLHGGDTLMLVLPADHHIADEDAFRAAVAGAVPLAQDGYLVTFGVKPEAPATGYGYIEGGEPIDVGGNARRIKRFLEKPDPATARRFVDSGRYVWNAGMFLFRADTIGRELERLCPDIYRPATRAVDDGAGSGCFLQLHRERFCAAPSISIDYAVMEHTLRGAVVPVTMGWSDIGSWEAVWEWRRKDADGNVLAGKGLALETRNTLLHCQDRFVATLGMEDLVVVDTADACLVAHRSRSEEVKTLVADLKRAGRYDVAPRQGETRVWGSSRTLRRGEGFRLSELIVIPGSGLPQMRGDLRAEHWIVISGTAQLSIDGGERLVAEGEAVHIAAGAAYRIANPGRIPLVLVRVQVGEAPGADGAEEPR